MIQFEYPVILYGIIREDLCRHYSDTGMQIQKVDTDEIYTEAIDLYPCQYQYEETNESIII